MKKGFSELSPEELLKMEQSEIEDSIKIEAINKGIQPRITLSEVVGKLGYNPCVHFPSENDIIVWAIGSGYHSPNVGWMTQEQALAALKGAISLGTTYKNGRSSPKIENSELQIVQVRIPTLETKTEFKKSLKEFTEQDPGKFDELVEECLDKLSKIRQDAYNFAVAVERKQEYLRLANGDEKIAQAFWNKAETLPWPQ